MQEQKEGTEENLPRVLIVEDQPIIRRVMIRALRGRWRAIEAGTLAQARKALEEGVPEAVVLDLRLPDGDGCDLISDVRSRSDEKQPRIVVVSGRPGDVGSDVLRKGADDYISKPFTADEFRAVLSPEVDR